tara:strand:+ start:502 stop:726 length:225 start_codon:yes stop_codon:yes gene_type:complete
MEIIFELENSDIEIEFTPDFDWVHKTQPGRNRSDFNKVQWKLQDRGGTAIVADVLLELPDETTYIIPNNETDDV